MKQEIIWIRKIKKGETQYFQNLYEKHHQRLYTLCIRFLHNQADAEEQLQEIFMRILKKIDRFRGDSSFATWSYRLAVNHLINFSRKPAPESEMLVEPGGKNAKPDLAMMLDQAIQALPDGFRQVFILHDRIGLAHEEIAGMLGCSPSTSRSQLSRARLTLRGLLKPALTEVTA